MLRLGAPRALLKYLFQLAKWSWPFRDYVLIREINKLLKGSHFKQYTTKSRYLLVLDLGCGDGITCFRLTYKSELRKYNPYIVGLDINIKKLYRAKRLLHDVVLGDASRPPFRCKSFDLIFMIEVLDHLPKRNGLKLLIKELDNLCRLGIIITCPHGETRKLALEPCVWERHNSDWYWWELRKFGYNVITLVPKAISSILMRLTRRPFLTLQLLAPFLSFITLPPDASWQLIAVKRFSNI